MTPSHPPYAPIHKSGRVRISTQLLMAATILSLDKILENSPMISAVQPPGLCSNRETFAYCRRVSFAVHAGLALVLSELALFVLGFCPGFRARPWQYFLPLLPYVLVSWAAPAGAVMELYSRALVWVSAAFCVVKWVFLVKTSLKLSRYLLVNKERNALFVIIFKLVLVYNILICIYGIWFGYWYEEEGVSLILPIGLSLSVAAAIGISRGFHRIAGIRLAGFVTAFLVSVYFFCGFGGTGRGSAWEYTLVPLAVTLVSALCFLLDGPRRTCPPLLYHLLASGFALSIVGVATRMRAFAREGWNRKFVARPPGFDAWNLDVFSPGLAVPIFFALCLLKS